MVSEPDRLNRVLRVGPLGDEGVWAMASAVRPSTEPDGLEVLPGRAHPRIPIPRYRLTGTVGPEVLDLNEHQPTTRPDYAFSMTAGPLRVIGRLREPNLKVAAGTRVALDCFFDLVDEWDWSLLDLPAEWASDWQVQEVTRLPSGHPVPNVVLDLEPAVGAPRVQSDRMTSELDDQRT